MSTYTHSGTRKLSPPKGTSAPRNTVTSSRVAPAVSDPRIDLHAPTVKGLHERRRRRRAMVPPMYTLAVIRVLSRKGEPMEGHILDLSETGMAVQVDSLIPVGQAVTIEFRVAGLGRIAHDEWTEFAAAAQVVRHDNLDDFPAGPYKTALRFVRIGTIPQAQIARFVATHPG
jgi:c-di-GMP-binding flagellar brake protein YcgR